MAEWSIAAVLKTVVPRGTRGSNPCLSAINLENQGIIKQTPSFALKNVKLGVFSYLRNYVEHFNEIKHRPHSMKLAMLQKVDLFGRLIEDEEVNLKLMALRRHTTGLTPQMKSARLYAFSIVS